MQADIAPEQLTVCLEETKPGRAEGLQIQPESVLAALHVEACTSPAHTVPSPRKRTKSFRLYMPSSSTALKWRKKNTDPIFNRSH